MTLLIVLIALIVMAIVLVSEHALRRIDEAGAAVGAEELSAALDQLSALERDAAAGMIGGEEAQASRAAIRARILAADRARRISVGFSPRARKLAGLVTASLLVVALAGLYQRYDSPFEWSDSATSRVAASAPQVPEGAAAVEALAATEQAAPSRSLKIEPQAQPQGEPRPPQGQPQRPLGTVDEMIGRLVARLDRNPSDVEGWRMLGWSYLNTDRYGQAVTAYAKAIALSPDNADLRSAYGEALVRRADGRVTDEARSAFATALGRDGKDARARFFMGLAKDQNGDKRAAFDDWVALLKEADSKEPWFADLKQRVAQLRQEMGDAASGPLRGAPAPSVDGLAPTPQSQGGEATDEPTLADIAGALAPDNRDAAIRGMVEGLAARLAQAPDDVEGWARLIRAREVLGETDEAKRVLQRALDVFKAAPQERAKIVGVARELGLME